MQWSVDPIYDSVWISGGLIAIIVAALVWISPRGVTGRRRTILTTLRGVAALMLILALLRPSLVRRDNRPSAATLAIAIDTSRSMTLASGETSTIGGTARTRWQQQVAAIESLAAGLNDLDENLRVKLIRFDRGTQTIGEGGQGGQGGEGGQGGQGGWAVLTRSMETLRPDGDRTNLAAVLRASIDTASTHPLAGVALLSDGTQTLTAAEARGGDNAGMVAETDPRPAARLVGAMGVPLWTVPLGPTPESISSRDVAVEGLPETYRLFAGNETEFNFEVDLTGLAGRPVAVTLRWIREETPKREGPESDGPESDGPKVDGVIAATRSVTTDQSSGRISVSVPLLAPAAGQYRLVVEAEAVDGETITANNTQVAFVDVRDGGGRVLYVEGAIRLEQQYLRRALLRFPDLDVTFRWIPADTSPQWPIELDVELSGDRYDVVILGDLPSAAIGDVQLDELARAVGDGLSLITLGGMNAYGPGGYADSAIADVLPIRMDGLGDGQIQSPITLQTVTRHPITSIPQPGAELLRWSDLPALPGASVWPDAKSAAGVQTLLADGDDRPMLVIGEYGKGRVASLAFDSTWMWWRGGRDEVHRRFWRQLVLWALSREETIQTRIDLQMSSRRFASSQTATFNASLPISGSESSGSGSSGSGSSGAITRLSASLILESGETMPVAGTATLRVDGATRTQTLAGSLPNLPPGFHRLRVQPDGPDQAETVEAAEVMFQVLDDTRELALSQTDHGLLRQLARLTDEAGGGTYRPDQMDRLAEEIRNRRTSATRVVIEKTRLADGPVSGWALFLILAGCLSTSWALRRRWGLA